MGNNIFIQIEKFVEKERWKYRFSLTENTRLYEDMKIYGDDANEFIIKFGKEFNVDVSKFMAADYFKGEGIDILGPALRFFTKGKNIQPTKTLTLGHLIKAINTGRLDEETINN